MPSRATATNASQNMACLPLVSATPVLSSSMVRSFPPLLLKERTMPVIMATAISDMMPPIASWARKDNP